MRSRCKVDLFYLAYDVLGYTLMTERTHRPICNFFIQKRPDLMFGDTFKLTPLPDLPDDLDPEKCEDDGIKKFRFLLQKAISEQDAIKHRLLLYPRGSFKSTLNVSDCIQWILCFPEIRILILSGEGTLAEGFVSELSDHFIKEPNQDPTFFQWLFPEFVIRQKDKRTGTFTAPNRRLKWKEPTIMANSIESSNSGWHFDIIKLDDVVTDRNSENETMIAKINRRWRINRKMLMPWGYWDMVGTRYGPLELYGDTIDKAKPGKLKLLWKPAWWVKEESKHKAEEDLGKEDYELLFPEILTYEFLAEERDDDIDSFKTQYLNDAMGSKEITFTKEKLLQATPPQDQMPELGEMFIAWRFACPNKPNMKTSAGVVGMVENSRLYILDAVHGQFAPSKLAFKVVDLARKWGVNQITVEETPGSRFLHDSIANYAITIGYDLSIQWTQFTEDDGAREVRIKNLEPLLNTARLIFADNIPALREMYKQFEHFKLITDDAIPDVISQLAGKLPRSIAYRPEETGAPDPWEEMKRRDLYDRTHGMGRYADPEPAPIRMRGEFELDELIPGLNG